MAITNHDRVGKALELLKEGLRPFVVRELEARHGKYWITTVTAGWPRDLDWSAGDEPNLDAAVLLRMMWEQWNVVFRAPWASPNAAWSASCATCATSGRIRSLLQRRRLPRPGLGRPPADRHLRAPGRRAGAA
jgi:hypothetical protein